MFKKLIALLPKYSPWIPLAGYGGGGNEFWVQARINLKTGLMSFKVKKVNGATYSHGSVGISGVVDIESQWELLLAKGF